MKLYEWVKLLTSFDAGSWIDSFSKYCFDIDISGAFRFLNSQKANSWWTEILELMESFVIMLEFLNKYGEVIKYVDDF